MSDNKENSILNYQPCVDQEAFDSKQKKIYLPDFFRKEFPNLSRFLYEDLLKDSKPKNINKADIYKC
jgi:hypothetical protein